MLNYAKTMPVKLFSRQETDVYKLLLEHQSLTAKDIAERLNIFPNTVYRTVKQLIQLGFVQQNYAYPVEYEAIHGVEGLELYSAMVSQHFLEEFPTKHRDGSKILNISFIRNREDLRKNTDRDVSSAKQTVNFIVSGLEVPAESILTYKLAADRGVDIRVLIQRLDDTSTPMFQRWKRIGVKVKYFPNMEARIFIIDEEIVYFTSYNPEHKDEAIGMRFDYAPYAKIMDELFNLRWKTAQSI